MEEKDYLVREKLLITESGLVSRDVYCSVQDELGFIWFETKYGLNRFDDVNCILLTTENGLYSNTITNLVKGEFNKINRYAVDGMFTTNMTFDRPLANGLYMIEAIFDGEVQTQRMMVQK